MIFIRVLPAFLVGTGSADRYSEANCIGVTAFRVGAQDLVTVPFRFRNLHRRAAHRTLVSDDLRLVGILHLEVVQNVLVYGPANLVHVFICLF